MVARGLVERAEISCARARRGSGRERCATRRGRARLAHDRTTLDRLANKRQAHTCNEAEGVVERLPPRSVPFVTAAPERPALNTTGLLTDVALSAGLRTPGPDVCPAQAGVSQCIRLRQGREHHQLPLPPAIIF